MPLTSNLVKWKSKLHFCSDLGIIFYVGQFFGVPPRPRQLNLAWYGIFFFFFLPWLLIPIADSEWCPLCFLLGECVALFSPHEEVAASLFFSPTRNSAKPFSPLTQGRGWRVCGTLVCPEAAFRLLWSTVA